MKIKSQKWRNKIELGEYLRSVREGRGLNQRQAAEQLQCSWPTFGLVERGGTVPGVNLLRRMSAFYEISLEDLMNVYYPPDKNKHHMQGSDLKLARS